MKQLTPKYLNLDEIRKALRTHLPELRSRYGIRSLELFGSYVRGEQKRGSDLDVLVEFDRIPTLFEFMDLEEELSRLLGIKVDLVTKKSLKGEIGKRILKEAVPL
ncbi:MAG: hypothetical protein DRP95_06740 [Candidatus Latescibacterota bacterium]|nr:MAG: hypothetical protein DRP95_06740 [Candidatus Latescibacterota bacterium]